MGGETGPPVAEKKKKLKCIENDVERERGDPLEGECVEGGRGTKGIKHFRKIKAWGEEEGPVATSHNNKDVSE